MSVAAYIIVHKNTAPHNCNKTTIKLQYKNAIKLLYCSFIEFVRTAMLRNSR